MPPTSTATGMINTACASERASEIAPTRDGDGTSPRMWIVKMLTATPVARMCGATTFTIVELTGPVEANNSSSATTIAVQRSEEHTSELQSRLHLVCRLLLEKKKKRHNDISNMR